MRGLAISAGALVLYLCCTAEGAGNPAPARIRPGQAIDSHGLPSQIPNGRVVARTDTPRDRSGRFRRVTILKQDGKYPLARIEEDVRTDARAKKERTQRRTAMVADHVIVRLKPGADRKQLDAAAAQMRTRVRRSLRIPGAFLVEAAGLSPEGLPDAVSYWRSRPFVEYAEPDYIVEANFKDVGAVYPNDPMFAQQWALHNTGTGTPDADIDAPEAWSIRTDASVLVAIIDTGMDLTHPDLVRNLWNNRNERLGDWNRDGYPGKGGVDDDGDGLIDEDSNGRSRFLPDGSVDPLWINDLVDDDDENGYPDDLRGWDFVNHDNDPTDDHFHGTHMGGTIGARGNNGNGITGVAWNVTIMPLKFMTPNPFGGATGVMSDAAEALDYAVAIGAKITSNSYGSAGNSRLLEDAVRRANEAGVLVVAAAGNAGTDNDLIPYYPAAYPLDNVVAVAASDENDGLAVFTATAASCYGATSVDIAAPGKNNLSTMPMTATSSMTFLKYAAAYHPLSGTSISTPHVAAACALLRSEAPGLTALQVKDAVLGSAEVKPAFVGKMVSSGRLNLHAALKTTTAACIASANAVTAEVQGNNDGVINPGETIGLTVTLKNVGAVGAPGVSATLSSATSDATVLPDTAKQFFGDIPAYQAAAQPGQFLVELRSGISTPAVVVLNLSISDTAGGTWIRPLTVRVYTSSKISGKVTLDGNGLPGAVVTYSGPRSGQVQTGPGGEYEIAVTDGTWTLSASSAGDIPSVGTPTIQKTTPPNQTRVDFAFTSGIIRGTVTDAGTGAPIDGAGVRFWGGVTTVVPAPGGVYEMKAAFGKPTTLFVTARHPTGHYPARIRQVNVPDYQQTIDFSLLPGPGFVVRDIGVLPGATQTVALAVSNRGQVVGWAPDAEGLARPIVYDIWSGMRSLEADPSGVSSAMDINNRGDIAGRIAYATAWYDGVPVNLGALVPLPGSAATGINDDRLVVGHSLVSTTVNTWQAFLFRDLNGNLQSDVGEMLCLGTFGGVESRGEAINAAGSIAGSAMTASGTWRGFIFRDANGNHLLDAGEMMQLGTLHGPTPPGSAASLVNDINASGQIVGQSSAPVGTHAFRFTDSNGNWVHDTGDEMLDLGDLGVPVSGYSAGYAVNDSGDVVGTSQVANRSLFEAFLWRNGTIMNLHDLVDSSDWFFNAAYGMNNQGWIVGLALHEGYARGFLIVPWSDCNQNGTADVNDIADGVSRDCNRNTVPDECDIASGARDCDGNGVPDECESTPATPDCNGNGVPDDCEIATGLPDCNSNGVPDECDITSGVPDCNSNGVPDECDLASGAPDCNGNGLIDACEIATGTPDCNGNGVPDSCDLTSGAADCNANGVPDACDLASGMPDCNHNAVPDACDIALGLPDCDGNSVPDECDLASGAPDCNGNGLLDSCDITAGMPDCNANGVPDACDLATGTSDCNGNGLLDTCEIASGLPDCDTDGVPDTCAIASGAPDCNSNTVPDPCEIASGAPDCNNNGVPDECDLASSDCNSNGLIDACEIASGAPDCNGNAIPDACDLASGAPDCNGNSVLDVCEIASGTPDCNGNGVPDACEIAAGAADCNTNGIPDECEIASGQVPDTDGDGVPDTCGLLILSWNSIRTHGAALELAIPLNPVGTPATGLASEPRAGGLQKVRVQLNRPAALQESAAVMWDADGNTVAAVCNLSTDGMVLEIGVSQGLEEGKCYTIDLHNALLCQDTQQPIVGDADCAVRNLPGDLDADGSVTTSDALQASRFANQPVSAGTAVYDVNTDGWIDANDAAFIESRIGRSAFCMPAAVVVGRHIFYASSNMKLATQYTPAPDKRALLPGQTATFSNISSYSRGLNGIYVDVVNLPGAPLTEDFEFRTGSSSDPSTWSVVPAPQISVLPGQGNGGSARIRLLFSTSATTTRKWLRVTVKPSERTGLAEPDVFYFGLLIGETGLGNTPEAAYVSTVDCAAVSANYSRSSRDYRPIQDVYDFNRDSLVNTTDAAICTAQVGDPDKLALFLITAPGH